MLPRLESEDKLATFNVGLASRGQVMDDSARDDFLDRLQRGQRGELERALATEAEFLAAGGTVVFEHVEDDA